MLSGGGGENALVDLFAGSKADARRVASGFGGAWKADGADARAARALLLLARDWTQKYLPHVLSKVCCVSFGLLSEEHMRTRESSRAAPSRRVLAVPYVGKDVPSVASEFANAESRIGATTLAYRYQGLRAPDVVGLVKHLRLVLRAQSGPVGERPARKLFAEWLAAGAADADAASPGGGETEILPLELFQPASARQLAALLPRLRQPRVIHYYLTTLLFADNTLMGAQDAKLTASAQELGGGALFGTRLAFSGTPSELQPHGLGVLFEPGSEGQMVRMLSDPSIVVAERVAAGWDVRSLLKRVATHDAPRFHALIDVGALVTGFSNEQVAAFLLAHGLPHCKGCVFVDEASGNSLILQRGGAVLELRQCGIAPAERFTYFDQVRAKRAY